MNFLQLLDFSKTVKMKTRRTKVQIFIVSCYVKHRYAVKLTQNLRCENIEVVEFCIIQTRIRSYFLVN